MLRNISVRTFIVYFLLCVFLVSDGVIALFSRNSSLFIAVIIVQFIALFLLWAYMTKYLVTPINTVKKSIEEVTSGKLGVSIPEFGNNCAGRLIPGINSLSSNIATLVREIPVRSTLFTQRAAFRQNRTAVSFAGANGSQHGRDGCKYKK